MAYCVSRDDVRRFIADAFSENRFATNYDYAILADKIDEIPAVDVQPMKRGRWLPAKDWFMSKCSECGYELGMVLAAGYICCPKCTARMDGDTNG